MASGTPEDIAAEPRGYTEQFLKEFRERWPGGRSEERFAKQRKSPGLGLLSDGTPTDVADGQDAAE